MRILAIDAGNTRIKWGWADEQGWLRQAWRSTEDAAGIAADWSELRSPERIVVSNVAGPIVRSKIAGALASFAAPPTWIVSRAQQCGVRSGYADPAQLGSDRWAALIGAWHLSRRSCVVASAGTTLTVDALSDEGVFLGGTITAGPELMRAALARHTAQLQVGGGAFYYFPDKTADAMASGAINALAGSVERMVRFMEETGQGTPRVVLTGGGASLLASRLNVPLEVVDNLVLEGLLRIALDVAASPATSDP
jgi:type III pantothenate kinase